MKRITACLLLMSGISCGIVEDREFRAENEMAQILVTSQPSGAQVYIEDVLTSERIAVGRTPMRPMLVSYWSAYEGYAEEERREKIVGKLRIVVEMNGYEKHAQTIHVGNQEMTHAVDVELDPVNP